MTSIQAATAAELADWDEGAVDAPGGHVYQSRAWAEHRVAAGWTADHLRFDDGFRALALRRPFDVIGGSSAYLPRGPISAGEPVERTAERLAAIVDHLAEQDVAVVASDAEIAAATGYGARLEAIGFAPIEEIQPSRHRISLPLTGRASDDVFGGIAKSTRQRIKKAEKDGTVVVRHDGRVAPDGVGDGFTRPVEPTQIALDRFYSLLLETGERLQFSFGPREAFLAWWSAAHRAGHLILLEARTADDSVQAGLVLYRHGERLSTVHSGDHADARRDHPGALHLLRWRAIELALREGRAEMDLGGVDVAGARREPTEDEPMWGLYQHKRSFGGEWLELTGAHERVLDANRYRVGRLASKAARLLRRG
ncbi:MAG: peptidoglycan bridge formation glycyltransferase FemA/FemB family protein [Chloroflexi bacterium]|nr:peptidoglycan bridge formation glycyltransferase FemA/FemB family protein [Chloroflexota bacterium]